jgi:hypothetical protein
MKQKSLEEHGVSAPMLLEFCLAKLQVMGCHVLAHRQRQVDKSGATAEICLVIDGGIYLMALGTNGLLASNGRDLHYVVHAEGTQPALEGTRALSTLIGKEWGSEVVEVKGLAEAVVKASKAGHQTLKLELWPLVQRVQIKTSHQVPGAKRSGNGVRH